MITSRRGVLASSAASGLMFAAGFGSWAKPQRLDEDDFPPIPADQAPYAGMPDVTATTLTIEQLGTAHPLPHEVKLAQMIMEGAPFGTHKPIDVARYFEAIGQGKENAKFGEDVRAYVAGWPVRYNPVIINFFKATRTQPLAIDGDGTSWCAAFVNWCIARALSKTGKITVDAAGIMEPLPKEVLKGTDSASSGSFRCWSSDTLKNGGPQPGDVIVWAEEGTVQGCTIGPGHVGLYVGRTADGHYLTLGGNQRDPRTDHHAVVQKPIGPSFSNSEGVNKLHSIRRVRL